ncbi:fibronectin type III domain-containing protein [Dyella humi]|uniref:Fibronectin type III domain-containing protein n=1 Tax=Dyella humi TaxID=1770547 RepID=A0ABW8IG78_9GAMM
MNCCKFLAFSLIVAIVSALTGCAKALYLTSPAHPYEWEGPSSASSISVPPSASSIDTSFKADVTDCNHLHYGNWYRIQKDFPKVVCIDIAQLNVLERKYYASLPGDPYKKAYRDQWVQILMRDIDVLWWGYKNGFLSNDDETKMTVETATAGVAAASAGLTAPIGKTAAAVVAATLSTFDSSFDKNVLANQMAPVLFAAIEAQREKIDSQIITGLKQDADQYTLVMASRDVMRYANAGSLSNALAVLSNQTGTAAAIATSQRDAVSALGLGAPTSLEQASPPAKGKAVINFKPPSDTKEAPIFEYVGIAQPTSGGDPKFFSLPGNNQTTQIVFDGLSSGNYTITLWAINSAGPGISATLANVILP